MLCMTAPRMPATRSCWAVVIGAVPPNSGRTSPHSSPSEHRPGSLAGQYVFANHRIDYASFARNPRRQVGHAVNDDRERGEPSLGVLQSALRPRFCGNRRNHVAQATCFVEGSANRTKLLFCTDGRSIVLRGSSTASSEA